MSWAYPQDHGSLDNIFAKFRARQVDALIPDLSRNGRVLDIGCGETPFFLQSIKFKYKYGINKWDFEENKVRAESLDNNLKLFAWDLAKNERLPFEDEYFDVVTMLAVFEHVEPAKISALVVEVRRILASHGIFVLTIPVWWTDRILKILAKIHLISAVGVRDHKDTYSPKKVKNIMKMSGFEIGNIETGYFEAFMNIWVKAIK